MQKARRHPNKSGLRPLVGVRFQGLFTPLLRVLFTFPSRYLFTIGLMRVFSLGRWSSHFQTGFLVSRPTRLKYIRISCTRLSLSLVELSRSFHYLYISFGANPRSLATTNGISVDFFSSGYLDVSVLRVAVFRRLVFN